MENAKSMQTAKSPFKRSVESTIEALLSPRKGDHFTEQHRFYMCVLSVTRTHIVMMEATAPCTFPESGVIKVLTKREFRERFTYANYEGSWVRLLTRDMDVDEWIERGIQSDKTKALLKSIG